MEPNMRRLIKIVIPKIAFMWKTVADFLDYDISTIEISNINTELIVRSV